MSDPGTGGMLERALEGVRVVALEQAVALPYCTFALAEMGAEVIKVERPGTGDVIRGWDSVVNGLSTGFVWVNAGKKSVTLDLRTDEDRESLRSLIASADVFAENLGPGAAKRLGVGPDDFPDKPDLIYVSVSGYGQDGPMASVKAYDMTMQAETGIMLCSGSEGAPAKVGLPITDLIAASNATTAITTALFQRTKTGKGAYLDVSMFDSSLGWLGYHPHHAWHTGAEPALTGTRHQFLLPQGAYRASDDRYVCLVVADDRQWRVMCEQVFERPEWIDDTIMGSIASRLENRTDSEAAVEAVIASRPSDEWFDLLDRAGLPYGHVNRITDVVDHPQAKAREMYVQAESPVGEIPIVRYPLASASRTRVLPGLGDHNSELLETND